MKLVVSKLHKEENGVVTSGEGVVVFFKDATPVHVEEFVGKCTSQYVRKVGKTFEYDRMLAIPIVVGGVFEVEIQ